MAEETIQMSVTIDDRRVTIEGPASFVRAEIQRITDTVATIASSSASPAVPTVSVPAGSKTEREFVAEKKPRGHDQHVAVLAYWLREHGTPEFREEDIRRAYIRAGVKPPKAVGQALRDAKKNKDFIEFGEERGTYRLSSHGERIVLFDLPPKDES